jgi:hypothetical protein
MFTTKRIGVLVLCLGAMMLPAGLSAQPASLRRPYRGLFGAPTDPNRQSLVLNLSGFGAYDGNLYHREAGTLEDPTDSTAQQNGFFGGGLISLNYNKPGRRYTFFADASAGVNYYTYRNESAPGYQFAVGLTAMVTRRARLTANEMLTYSPDYRLSLFSSPLDSSVLADPYNGALTDYDLYKSPSYRSYTSISLARPIGRRLTLDVFYGLTQSVYSGEVVDYRTQYAGFRLTRQMTRNLGVHAGYSYYVADYPQNQLGLGSQGLHNLDIGVDYSRALSVSRRTQFSFSTGSAVLASQGTSIESPESSASNTTFYVLGSANLTHEMGRTWTAGLSFSRSVDFHEGFGEPFFSDSISAALTGLLTRRLHSSSYAATSFGNVGVGSGNRFNGFGASTGLGYGLFRVLELFVDYVYYHYRFDEQVAFDPRFPRAMNRQGIRFGAHASFSLIH